jgi:hypothetical protein
MDAEYNSYQFLCFERDGDGGDDDEKEGRKRRGLGSLSAVL